MNDGFYFIWNEGKIFGPFRADRIGKMLGAHVISSDALISSDKRSWSRIETLFAPEAPAEGSVTLPEPSSDRLPADEEIPLRRQEKERTEPEETGNTEEKGDTPPLPVSEATGVRIAGAALQLVWNTQDRLMFLFRRPCLEKCGLVVATAFLFSLLLAALCWGSMLCYGLPGGKTALFLAAYTASLLLLIPLEFWMLRVIFAPRRGSARETWLLASMTVENVAALSVLAFLGHFARLRMGEAELGSLLLPLRFLLLFAGAFFTANLTAGLTRGLRRAFHFRSRHGIWCGALLTAQFLWFFAAAVIFVDKYLCKS